HYPNRVSRGSRTSAGDRILVQKYLYSLSEPRRWDVVVFKAPHQPETNYIKRLVGLPNESLLIIDGNIYVKSHDPNASPADRQWHIARKTDTAQNRHAQAIQRAVWQPIYRSDYVPLDRGQFSLARPRPHTWQVPWDVQKGDADDWKLQNRRSYRYDGTDPSGIRFNFESQMRGGPGEYPYNQWKTAPVEPIEDVRVAATFVPDAPGLAVQLQTTSRMDDPTGRPMTVIGEIDAQGNVTLKAQNRATTKWKSLCEPSSIEPFASHRPRTIELWHVDQEVSLWVDGQKVLTAPYQMSSIQDAIGRKPAETYPTVQIVVSGSPVTLHHVELDRDIYYSTSNPHSGGWAHGGVTKNPKRATTASADDLAMTLGSDHFFCLGDNSPSSLDSRYWEQVDPWITKRMFGNQTTPGVVPRPLMMGRAFFIYWPAPYRWPKDGVGLILPNFSDIRSIH
ncbi:MAG: signal peptidase I, partial [Phycisphaeraceae bacterium]